MQTKIFNILMIVLIIIFIVGLGLGYWSLSKKICDIQTEIKNMKQIDEVKVDAQIDVAKEKKDIEQQDALTVAGKVIKAIENKSLASWSTYIHPEKGVKFSPYFYVEDDDLVFMPEDLKSFTNSRKKYEWGVFDGTGLPINLNFNDYYDRFIYDEDFSNAESISVDKFIGSGNTINNIKEYYPGATTVEFHFSGFEQDLGGMDWKSLVLVLEQSNGQWYLVGVVHGEWTI